MIDGKDRRVLASAAIFIVGYLLIVLVLAAGLGLGIRVFMFAAGW